MPYRLTLLLVAAAALLLMPTAAAADDDAYQEMLQLSRAAADAVDDGNFELGAVKFRQAFDAHPDPVLLNNEMIAWYRADDCHNALVPARTFLDLYGQNEEDIDESDRRNVRTVTIECHLQLAERALDDDDLILANYHLDMVSPKDHDDDEQQRYTALRDDLSAHPDFDAAPSDDTPSAAASPGDGSSSQHFAWGQIAGGVALAGIGLSMHTVALSRQSQLQSLAEEDASLFEERRSDWSDYQNTARWMVPTLYVLSAAAIGSGTYFLLRDESGPGLSSISPAIGPDHTGLTLTGQF